MSKYGSEAYLLSIQNGYLDFTSSVCHFDTIPPKPHPSSDGIFYKLFFGGEERESDNYAVPVLPSSNTLLIAHRRPIPSTTHRRRDSLATDQLRMVPKVKRGKGRHKKAEDAIQLREAQRKAEKRREASRRYYAAHPEVREKNRIKIAERRLAAKIYRRQWDPPKAATKAWSERSPSHSDECDVDDRGTPPPTSDGAQPSSCSAHQTNPRAEETAHAALRAMYRKNSEKDVNVERAPLSLAAIDTYESSVSNSEGTRDWEGERVALALRLQEEAISRHATVEDARLDREKAARMRIHIETGPAAEELYEFRGSMETTKTFVFQAKQGADIATTRTGNDELNTLLYHLTVPRSIGAVLLRGK
ncbi:hypothetical protein DFH06DRAFT_1342949 [Mycena polygramma]|nr:hypothetical protein DFH06DRAFT_1342949 [Mycena polygramma]